MSTQQHGERPASSPQEQELDEILAEHPARDGVDDPEVWLRQFMAEAEALAAQARAVEDALATQEAEVENKFMRMRMGASGQITSLVFSPSANAATAAQLTEAFQELHVQAAAQTTRTTLAMMSAVAGEDDPSLDLIRNSVSPEVAEQMAIDEAADPIDPTDEGDHHEQPSPLGDEDGTDDDDERTGHLGAW